MENKFEKKSVRSFLQKFKHDIHMLHIVGNKQKEDREDVLAETKKRISLIICFLNVC